MVSKPDAPSLLDVLTRHQAYLEGLKQHEGEKFGEIVVALRRGIRELLLDADVDRLSDLTRRDFDRVVRKLRQLQAYHYDRYTAQVLDDLAAFAKVETDMTADILRDTQDSSKEELAALALLLSAKSRKTLWATLLSAIIPATGATVGETLSRFREYADIALVNAVRQGYANKQTIREILRAVGGASQQRDGLLLRQHQLAEGMTATLWQHAAGIVQNVVAPVYFDRYIWVSVLDGRTSTVCQERNGRVYAYGEGPLPPAHPRCRSKTVPADDGVSAIVAVPTYFGWIQKQPRAVQDDILGKPRGVLLRAGRLAAADLPKMTQRAPLTLDGFRSKLALILAR